jgi:membrane protein YdbS with pleckstrin-like domain
MRTPLQKGEKVLLVTHTSWVKLIVPVLIGVIGWVASFFIGFLEWGWLAALVGSLYFIVVYFSWKVNIWVVTNFRVIDEAGLLNHFAKESPLEKINNVSYDQTLWGRILNFGHVEIQTAAEVGATDYFNVHGPKRLKDTITLAQAEYKNLQLASQAQHMATAMGIQAGEVKYASSGGSTGIASELEKLHQLKQQGIISEEEYIKAKNKLLG